MMPMPFASGRSDALRDGPGRAEHGRSQITTLGLILAAIFDGDRPRLLLLRASGEIWPVSAADVQFIMPSSLIPSSLADRCWSPALLEALARGDEVTGEEEMDADMLGARRQVMMILRKIKKETEKMTNRFASNLRLRQSAASSRQAGKDKVDQGVGEAYAGMQAVWDAFASPEPGRRGAITAVQAAQILLGPQADGTPTIVRPNTLPAYAAHELLMANPHHFLATERNLWENGMFMVRSRDEVERIRRVEAIITRSTPALATITDGLVDKVKSALSARLAGEAHTTEWTSDERHVLHALAMRLYESRTTQQNPYIRIATVILRTIDPYPGEAIDDQLIARMLQDIGVLPQCDTMTTSKSLEAVCRALNMQGVSTTDTGLPLSIATGVPAPAQSSSGQRLDTNGLRKGDELDNLRTDFSSHRVWVIDDASALELDDGISLQRIEGSEDVWIHVHVADPTSIIPLDHPIARRASFAGSALYLPEGNTPLFPLPQVMSRFSLGAANSDAGQASMSCSNSGQSVLTISARVTPQGTYTEHKVELGWIENARLTTYRAVDEAMGRTSEAKAYQPFGVPEIALAQQSDGVLDEAKERVRRAKQVPINDAERTDIEILYSTAKARRRHRLRNAGIDFSAQQGESTLYSASRIAPIPNIFASPANIPSPAPVPGAKEEVYVNYSVQPTKFTAESATQVVSEIMLLAGRVCAQWCADRGIAIPFRGGRPPTEIVGMSDHRQSISLADVLAQKDEDGYLDTMLIRRAGLAFSPGYIDTKPIDHWQIGLVGEDKGYARATSPLRRFDDFLVHSQIKSWLSNQAVHRSSTGLTARWGRLLGARDVMAIATPSEEAQRRNRLNTGIAQSYWLSQLIISRLADRFAKGYVMDGSTPFDFDKPLTGRVLTMPVPMGGGIGSMGRMDVEIPELQCVVDLQVAKKADSYEIGQEVQVRIVNAVVRPRPIIRAELA